MKAGQKVRTPVCREDSEDLGAGLNLDRCTIVGGLFWTTFFLCLGLHCGVCCRDIRDVSLVQHDISDCKAQVEFCGASQHYHIMLIVTNMRYVHYGMILAHLEQ